jgi:hypothetical protein
MSRRVNCLRLQVRRPLLSSHAIVRVAIFSLLLGGLCSTSSAQNVQGLPAVGTGGTTQASSQMLIDATQFGSGTDM